MSGDGGGDDLGIVFGEVAFREPRRARRPDRDPRVASLAYEVPRPDDLAIFIDRRAADAIERHALRDTSVELGGVLLGRECVDDQTGEPFVWVTQALEARHYENTQASFTYTHATWEEINRERDRLHPELDIVGWYHTHPDYGIFLSGHDLFIHRNFFDQPLQVALVVDPIRQTRGFFRWRNDQLEQVGGYFVTADRGDRVALARLVHDLENLPPGVDGGGGGLSPRLEAELIAMLSRPAQVTAADRPQTAALFALIGAMAGALGLGLAMWMVTLGRQVDDQSVALAALAKALETTAATGRDEVEDARVAAKERALDALLAEVKVGDGPERLRAAYERVAAERDAARREAALSAQVADDLIRLKAESTRQADRLTALQQARTVDAAELKALRPRSARAAELETKLETTEAALAKSEAGRKLLADVKSGLLPRKYNWAWWAALAGWASALGLLAALVARLAQGQVDPDPAPPKPLNPVGGELPHRIE